MTVTVVVVADLVNMKFVLHAMLEITVGHRTLSDQISKLSDQFYNMVGHDVRAPK